jgi:hypothetical protein
LRQAVPASAASETAEPLIETVTRVQRADGRFQHIRPEVRGGVVRLNGEAARWTDVHELARRLARLPGVERVLLGELRIGGS